jgi:hypothetical protein
MMMYLVVGSRASLGRGERASKEAFYIPTTNVGIHTPLAATEQSSHFLRVRSCFHMMSLLNICTLATNKFEPKSNYLIIT